MISLGVGLLSLAGNTEEDIVLLTLGFSGTGGPIFLFTLGDLELSWWTPLAGVELVT